MNEKIELKERDAQPTLAIRCKATVEELPRLIGESYMKIANYMAELGEQPGQEPYTAYYSLDMKDLDVEFGFPISKRMPGKGEIIEGSLPAGPTVSCLYKGPYTGMEEAYNEIYKWIADNQYEPVGVYYEFYYNSPMEVPESELLTRMEIPVKKK